MNIPKRNGLISNALKSITPGNMFSYGQGCTIPDRTKRHLHACPWINKICNFVAKIKQDHGR